MKSIREILLVVIAVILSPTIVWAGPCDATFNFDGNLSDSSGNGNDGTMIGKGGVPATPVYVEGRSGQALRFDGTSAMRAPLDIYISSCPQVTISAWVKIDADSPKKTQAILSTGSGSGPGIRISGTGLSLNGPANGLFQANAIRPNSGWRFVAGVYDYEAGTFALHWRDRPLEVVPMSPNIREWEDMLWVGAMNDTLSPGATGIVIDDVRIVGRASTFDELRNLKASIPAGAPGTEGIFWGDQSPASESEICTAAQVAGTYRSEFNNMQCKPEGRVSVSCCYGAECRSTVTLAVAADGQSATGFWKQPDGTSGSATFQIDESCSLESGQWGYGTAAATRPWDTTGVVARVGGSTSTSSPGGSGGAISPPSGRVVISGSAEQIDGSTDIDATAVRTQPMDDAPKPDIGDSAAVDATAVRPTIIGDAPKPDIGDSAAVDALSAQTDVMGDAPKPDIGDSATVDATAVRPSPMGDAPKPDIGDGTQRQAEPQVMRSLQVPVTESDSGIPQGVTGVNASAGGEVGLSDSDSGRLQAAADEDAPLELGYDSEEEGIAAAEAAAEARADAAAAESQEPSQASGIPRASGEPVFSGVSGYSGSIIRTVDLRYQFLESVHWLEKSDRPCRMQVSGWVLDDIGKPYSGDAETFGNMRCKDGSWNHKVRVSGKAITRIQVCNNDRSNQRLKGMRAWGSQINSDGTTTYVPTSDSDEGPNCSTWSQSVLCPSGTVGTGLVVHATQADGDREQIVGLQLVCRSISLQ